MTKKWLEARKSYLKKIKKQVALIIGEDDKEVSLYQKSNQKLYNQIWDFSTREEFYNDLTGGSIVFCGDFHSSSTVKRFYLRFVQDKKLKLTKKPIWTLECFYKEDQNLLDKWLLGRIDEKTFLEQVNWSESWGFAWSPYKELILGLKKQGFDLRGINSKKGSLKERDLEISQNLLEIQEKNPKEILFCMIGQHHLGPDNLPKVLTKLNEYGKNYFLHLDPEEIYFQIEELNLSETESVLRKENHFCFLTTPPWVHWQSYLIHLEERANQSDYDEEEDYGEINGEDYNETFKEYLRLLREDMGVLDKPPEVGVSFIDEYVVDEARFKNLIKIMRPMMETESSFYWPEQKEGILVRSSLNQVATVAGKYLHIHMMGLEKLPWGEVDKLREWCWMEAVGYLLSKLINPKRAPISSNHMSEFLTARLGQTQGVQVLKKLIADEIQRGADLEYTKNLTWEQVVYASRIKGSLVGEGLFRLYSRGRLSVESLKTYMSVSINNKSRFEPFYKMVLDQVREFLDVGEGT